MKKIVLLIVAGLTWQVAAQHPTPQAVPVSCVGCDVLPGPVTLSCKSGTVQVDHTSVKLSSGWKISWTTLTASGQTTPFTLTFPATRTPCNEGSSFDQTNPFCTLSSAPQQQYPTSYTYTVHINGCSPGTGTIQYLKPGAKLAAIKQKAPKASY